MAQIRPWAWAGVDVGKSAHHLEVVDGEGRTLVRRRVENDQAAIEAMLCEATATAEQVVWAVDVTSRSAALLLGHRWELNADWCGAVAGSGTC